jgi:hypothetical protein
MVEARTLISRGTEGFTQTAIVAVSFKSWHQRGLPQLASAGIYEGRSADTLKARTIERTGLPGILPTWLSP